MDVSSRHSIAELQERQNRPTTPRNLRIIILAKQGWTALSIGMAMDLSRRVVQQRVYDYNEQGLSALEEQRGTPPRPLLTPDQEQVLAARIEAGPRPEDQVCSLRGKDFQRILQVEFGQRLALHRVDLPDRNVVRAGDLGRDVHGIHGD